MAVSERTFRLAKSEVKTVAMVTPADGPSFSTAPAGKWMCISVLSKLLQSKPYCQKEKQGETKREKEERVCRWLVQSKHLFLVAQLTTNNGGMGPKPIQG